MGTVDPDRGDALVTRPLAVVVALADRRTAPVIGLDDDPNTIYVLAPDSDLPTYVKSGETECLGVLTIDI